MVSIRDEDPVHPNTTTYARIVGPGTLTNEGWDGVATQSGQVHRLSLAAWRVFGDGALTARVADGDLVLSEATVGLPERGWNWLNVDLPAGAAGRGQFQLEIPQGLTVELDAISLRPLGADGEPLTFRPDLLAVLKDLRPSFIRFPGGCVAHGAGLSNMYHWKPTVGPRHEREHTRNVWGYHQSRQIGYLEYFQLCEAVGATPMPIVAAGVCCQNTRGGAIGIPMDEMPAYVQDVLDLVEFANGATDSAWGARRAELGHPEPFGLRYLGIGNEDAITDDFRVRCATIEDAVRERYPDLTIIGTAGPLPFGLDFEAGWEFARERGTDVVDEHAYRSPRWFHQNIDRYAAYSRDEPAVYFGEWAARTNTVRSALAEAAFMVGMERNSDVVRLASYAPLLARMGGTQWVPDLIYFDADRVYPSASCYVQQAFAAERGEQVHAVEITGADPAPMSLPANAALRVQSPGAQFDITDLVIDGQPHPAFTTEADAQPVAPINAGAVTIEFTATRTHGDKGLAIDLGDVDQGHYLQVHVPNWTGRETVINRFDDHIPCDDDGPFPWRSLGANEELHIRIHLDGARVRVWIDGDLLHDYEQDLRPEHRVVAGAASRHGADGEEYVVRLVNATDTARSATITLPGNARPVVVQGTILAGAEPDAGSPAEPSPVTPEPFEFTSSSDALAMELPPYSFGNMVIRPCENES